MANNGNGTRDPLMLVLTSIEGVRAELAGLRADLAGSPPAVAAAAGQARKNPWTGLTENQRAVLVAQMQSGRKAKKEREFTSDRAPTDWRLFADRVRSLLAASGYKGKDLGHELIQFASSLKEEKADLSAWSDEEILARRESWSPPSSATKVAAPLPAAAAANTVEFKPIMLAGNRYLVNLATGHTYHRLANGSQGDWAGIFHRTGGPKGGPYIDDSVPEPSSSTESTFEGGKRNSTRKHKHPRKQKKTRKH
jgi:hypothetical protein